MEEKFLEMGVDERCPSKFIMNGLIDTWVYQRFFLPCDPWNLHQEVKLEEEIKGQGVISGEFTLDYPPLRLIFGKRRGGGNLIKIFYLIFYRYKFFLHKKIQKIFKNKGGGNLEGGGNLR